MPLSVSAIVVVAGTKLSEVLECNRGNRRSGGCWQGYISISLDEQGKINRWNLKVSVAILKRQVYPQHATFSYWKTLSTIPTGDKLIAVITQHEIVLSVWVLRASVFLLWHCKMEGLTLVATSSTLELFMWILDVGHCYPLDLKFAEHMVPLDFSS